MVYAGIDVGSRTTKAALVGADVQLVATALVETGTRGDRAAEQALSLCLSRAGLDAGALTEVVATGYGAGRVAGATRRVTEITCHARGAALLLPGTRTVLDIGGQDAKAICLDAAGAVIDFAMNDRCAAGTGRFLEFMARILEMDVEGMGRVGPDPERTQEINSLCTVFAESEVVSFLAEGVPVDRIVRGLHQAVAVYNPGAEKVPALRQVEAILTTFRTVS